MTHMSVQLLGEVVFRLGELAGRAERGELDPAVDILVAALREGGVIHAFGTGHSEAFAMEMSGRAGGLIAASRIELRDLVLYGHRSVDVLVGPDLERDPSVVDELMQASVPVGPHDAFVIASNSGVNASIVGLALWAHERQHPVIAVTSMSHTMSVTPKHASGKRLCDVADVTVDNLAPYGDTTLELDDGVGVGAVSSMTAAFIAQELTVLTAQRLGVGGDPAPVYISANIPGGDAHNEALEVRYEGRVRHHA